MVAQTVKCLPTTRETWVQSLGRKDLLEKRIATHSSILASPSHPQNTGSKKYFGEGNSNPVLLPGESQGRGSLVGCRLWGRTESDTTEVA